MNVSGEPARPDPDALLRQITADEHQATRGKLRVYLGSAPGVGKTFAMLQEGQRRKSRGTDVVIGFVETYARPKTAEQIDGLEIVPPKVIPYKGIELREMDTDAVITRHPQVVLVDELAHSCVPGSGHEKRYQQIEDLQAAGITVISTLNIQHIESLNDTVQQITGIPVNETVPDRVLDEADQIELIDMAPEALIQRMKHGNIYPPAQAQQALANFFRAGNLTALRELALRATAREVDEKLTQYMHEHAVEGPWPVTDRVMVAVDHRSTGKKLIRRAWRTAAAFKATLLVVHVDPEDSSRQPQTIEEERQLRLNLQLADDLGGTIVRLRGDVAHEIVSYARENNISHLVIGHPTHGRWHEFFRGSVSSQILRELPDIDVHVVADQSSEERSGSELTKR